MAISNKKETPNIKYINASYPNLGLRIKRLDDNFQIYFLDKDNKSSKILENIKYYSLDPTKKEKEKSMIEESIVEL
jgi:hypothetical protein